MRPTVLRTLLATALLAYAGSAMPASLTVHVADQSAAPVEDAVVYAIPTGPVVVNRSPANVEIAQVKLAFTPLVTVVQTGGSVAFPNRDTVRHHVYSFSPAKIFELRLYAGLPATPVVFDKPGLVVLGCNIHDRMVAYVMVVDTPWYGKTSADGHVKIAGLPAGEYKVAVWNPRLKADGMPKTVNVTADASVDTVVDLKPAS